MVTALKAFTLYGQGYASGAEVASGVWSKLPDHRRTQMLRNRFVESSDTPIVRRKARPVAAVAAPAPRTRGRPRKVR